MIIISFRYAIRVTDYQLQLSHQIHQLQTIIQKLILIVIINSDFLYFWFLFICSVFSTFEVLSWNSLYSRSNNSRLYHPILRLKKVAMTILEVALLYATLSKYSVTEHFLSQSGGTFFCSHCRESAFLGGMENN